MKITATLVGRTILILISFFFAYQLLSSPQSWTFLDFVDVLIHEAGHLIFLPFGEFMHILGGSLLQILLPCIFWGYFFFKKEYFSSGFMLLWVADNIINISVYMRDAHVMVLPMLGGGESGIHDWNWLFSTMNLLSSAETIGIAFYWIGVMTLIAALGIMIIFTFKRQSAVLVD